MDTPMQPAAIGVFDSGVGGLSVLRAIRRELPCHPVLYVADQAHVPYGAHSLEEVRRFSAGITRFLIEEGARVIVVACNSASAAALRYLRETIPGIPFVGMEPAVKPAAAGTQSGVIGVLATPVTFQGELYAQLVQRFASSVTVLQDTCPGLVQQVEQGDLEGPATRDILERALLPMMEKDVDAVVMGCTHYPFVIPLIRQIVGEKVQVIDPSPAVARQVRRVLEPSGRVDACESPAPVTFFTTGDPYRLGKMLPTLLGEGQVVQYAQWGSGIKE